MKSPNKESGEMVYTRRQFVGWLAVVLSTAIACFWAVWGIIENFHEGWYYDSFVSNLGLMFVQYLSPLMTFVVLSQLSIYWPRIGSIAHALLGLLIPVALKEFNFTFGVFITLPLVLLAGLYWFGRPMPRRVASAFIVGFSTLALLICGIEPAVRVAGRIDDNNLQARLIEGNGVRLIWAPDGDGWPRVGLSWSEAAKRCQYLDENGLLTAATPQNIWRLPGVEEAVRSMSRHGVNSSGVWDVQNGKASYQITPDKESPLWNIHSQIIYWWTATELDDKSAYIIVYDGKVWPRRKLIHPAYLGFRCVKPAQSTI